MPEVINKEVNVYTSIKRYNITILKARKCKLASTKGNAAKCYRLLPDEEGAQKIRVTASGLRNRQTELPDGHRVMGAVVIAGNGVEVRQTVPVLVACADIQTQQARLLMVTQRLSRGKSCRRQLRTLYLVLNPLFSPGAWPSACTATRSPLTQPCCLK